jgi:hypothetical protein
MTAVYIVGALLWAYVLLRLLRRIADRRKALAAWQARRAEAERAWQERENERMATWRELQHVMVMQRLEEMQ